MIESLYYIYQTMNNSPYPYLPENREIKYVSIDNPFMKEAMRVRDTLSNDLYFRTGAVVVLNSKIIGYGANKSILGNEKLIELHKNGWCIRKMFKVKSGNKYWLCPGCSSPNNHAENRAIIDAYKKNGAIDGADLYLYGHWWCCKDCWNSIIKHNINNVFLVSDATTLFKRQ